MVFNGGRSRQKAEFGDDGGGGCVSVVVGGGGSRKACRGFKLPVSSSIKLFLSRQ